MSGLFIGWGRSTLARPPSESHSQGEAWLRVVENRKQ
jgi:hypothetical protein